jgi:nucleotide-binding universal stress UspA family protein
VGLSGALRRLLFRLDWSPEKDALTFLDDAIGKACPEGVPVPLTHTAREGGTARTLIEESRDAYLLVLGSRGHGGFAGLLLGSVSAACAEHAPCPVLIMHGNSATAN